LGFGWQFAPRLLASPLPPLGLPDFRLQVLQCDIAGYG
jgi:hypothetical protein